MVSVDVVGTALVGVLCALVFTRYVLPELVSRVVVAVLRNPGVQSAICDPISACLGKSLIAHIGPAMVAANTNPEVCTSAPKLLLGDEAQRIVSRLLADFSLRADVQQQTKSMVARTINSDEVHAVTIRLMNEIVYDSDIKQGLKDLIVDSVLDPKVHHASCTAAVSTMGEFFKTTQKNEDWFFVRDNIRTNLKEALLDEDLYKAAIKGGFGTIKVAFMDVMQDPEIRDGFRSAIKDTLLDVEVHQANFKGALNSITPNLCVKDSVAEWKDNMSRKISSLVEFKSASAAEVERLNCVTPNTRGLCSLEEEVNSTGSNPALAVDASAALNPPSPSQARTSPVSRPQVRYAVRTNSKVEALFSISSLADTDDPLFSACDSSDDDIETPSPISDEMPSLSTAARPALGVNETKP